MGVAGIGVISGTPGVRSEEGVAAYFGKGACPLVEIAAQGETSPSPKKTHLRKIPFGLRVARLDGKGCRGGRQGELVGGSDERFDILRRHLLEMLNFSADSVLTGMIDE